MIQRATDTSSPDREAYEEMNRTVLARYTLVGRIARGQLTVLHMALPRGSGTARPVALKRLQPQLALCPVSVQALRHEAWVSSRFHHAHLTRCIELIETAGTYCIVQNYVDGDNLANLLRAANHGSQERVIVPLIVDVLEGLHAIHTALDDQGWPLLLVHGSIRAHHVLVGVDGLARLTDFSASKARRGPGNHVESGQHDNLPQISPEQVIDPASFDHRSDLFLVGVMLWEALTGRTLFAAETEVLTIEKLLRRPILPPSKVGHRPNACFDEICLRALARDPGKRYASALEMATALRDAGSNENLFATRTELGEWVQARVQMDDEPTARFTRSPHSDVRELSRSPRS